MHYNCLNEAMSCEKSVMPTAGMCGTMFVGSDRYKVVCLDVMSPKHVLVGQHIHNLPIINKGGIDYYDGDVTQLLESLTPSIEKVKRCYSNATDTEITHIFEWEKKNFFTNNHYSLRKNGRWMPKGSGAWGTCAIHWGKADEYLDPCF